MESIAIAGVIVCLAVAVWMAWVVCRDLNNGLKQLVDWFFSHY